MKEQRFIELAAHFMSLPTVAFHEHFVIASVEAFAHAHKGISFSQDCFGNLLLFYDGRPRRSRKSDTLIATAHLDHPGLGFPQRISKRNFHFEKLGGIDVDQALGSSVRIYSPHAPTDQQPLKGKIRSYIPAAGTAPPKFEVRVAKKAGDAVATDSFAVWDLLSFKKKGRLIHGRACDDLAGVAVGLAYLDEIAEHHLPIRAGLLLTRAEEIGFGGMLAAAGADLLDAKALYINIECSSSKAGAQLGNGPVIRVGDRWCIFDPTVTGGLVAVADQLATANPGFRFQRKLMDGGICEASLLANAGLHTGAVALPLDNYHNKGKKRLKPEAVHLDDAMCLVDLLVHLASAAGGLDKARGQAQKHLEKRLSAQRRHVESRLK